LKKSAQKTFDSRGRLSGQSLAAQTPAGIESFFGSFFAKKELLSSLLELFLSPPKPRMYPA